jgi:alanine racemase
MQTCWIEISRSALAHNLRTVQTLVGDSKVIAVVKANAYGCGAIECSRVFAAEGAAMLAVTRVAEAVPLRESGIETPILLLSPSLPEELEEVVCRDLTASVGSFADAQALSEVASKLGKTANIHIKINTGMNRFGALPETVAEIVGRSRKLPGITVEGAFSHHANATAKDEAPTNAQFEEFKNATHGMKGVQFHVANSATLIRFPQMRLDSVRPGTLLYGQFPAPELAQQVDLKLQDPFAAKARIVAIQKVSKGAKFGYGSEWTAPTDSKLAILAVGFADGLSMEPNARALSPREAIKSGIERAARLLKNPNAGRMVTIREQKAPIVGRIAMQTCAVDVSKIEGAAVGDEVIVPMRRLAAGQNLARVYID